jgi:tRNA (adenine22-N1)-methyltransferase
LEPGEANGAILAGMGGILMVELLESAQVVVEKFEFLLLQPAQNPEILRKYLYQNNFEIMDEELVQEERRFYEYFLVRKSKKDVDIYPSICEYSIGSILLEKKHPLLQVYIESKIQELAVISEKIHGTTENAKIKMERLNHKMRELRRVKDEYLC